MRILPINNYNYAPRFVPKNQINFGDIEAGPSADEALTIKGDKFDLQISNRFLEMFNVLNRSRRNNVSRFLLNPKDERYSDIVIIIGPTTIANGKQDGFIGFQNNPERENAKTNDFDHRTSTAVVENELKLAKKMNSDLNPPKEVIEKARTFSIYDFDSNHNYAPDNYSRDMFKQFCSENGVIFRNAIVYPTVIDDARCYA